MSQFINFFGSYFLKCFLKLLLSKLNMQIVCIRFKISNKFTPERRKEIIHSSVLRRVLLKKENNRNKNLIFIKTSSAI